MALFPTLSQRSRKEKTVHTAREQTLRAQFVRAVHGNYCRTQKFVPHDDIQTIRESWLYASEDKETGLWDVFEVNVLPNAGHSDNRDTEKIVLLAEEKPFIDAMEILARFEWSGEEMERTAIEEDMDVLGYRHFRAFSLREGLAFDEDGNVQPTRDGILAVPGRYSPLMQDIVLTHMNDISAETDPWPQLDLSKLADPDDMQSRLADIRLQLKELQSFQKVMSYVGSMIAITFDYYGRVFDGTGWKPRELMKFFKLESEDYDYFIQSRPGMNGSTSCFYNMCDWVLDKCGTYQNEEFLTVVNHNLALLSFYFELHRAKATIRVLQSGVNESDKEEKMKDEAFERMDQLGRKLGFSEVKIKQFKSLAYVEQELPVPEDIAAFTQWLDRQYTNIQKSIDDNKKALARPPGLMLDQGP